MSVNFEVKGMLAKLLATEDIIVEHKKVETACFNVHTRVLTLPMWERASNDIYDLLCAHEVGHSRYTDNVDWNKECDVPQQFVNVCEDARVEKLIKRRYPGLTKTFYRGYKELSEQDFFCIEGDDVSTYNLADRANLFFKIGNFISLSFSSNEQEIIDLIGSAETFNDVLIAAKKLYDYCKNDEKEKEKVSLNSESHQQNTSESSESSEQSQESEDENYDEKSQNSNQGESEENQNNTEEKQNNHSSSQHDKEEPEVKTMNNLDEKIKSLINNLPQDSIYFELPKVNLSTVIAKNSEIHNVINSEFKLQQEKYKINNNTNESVFEIVDSEYKKFKLSVQKEVNYLVKEFECRKAADAYSRSSIARTGVLDTSKLHTYKFNEDLFKKISVTSDGKNHGLVFVLDWSGSMSTVLKDTCKQMFSLIWFCRKVSIPFEVYAFTNEWNRAWYNNDTLKYEAATLKNHYQEKEGLIMVDSSFSMMNIITSKVSGNELEKQLLNIWRIACVMNNPYSSRYSYPSRLSLSGTPLNESLICLHQIIPHFQKEHKLQKVECIILTDGEANSLPYHCEIKRYDTSDLSLGLRHLRCETSFLRDRKLGTTYKFKYGSFNVFTDLILQNLKDNFSFVNFIGIRVLPHREMNHFVSLYYNNSDKQYNKIYSDWKKMKSFIITDSGYDAYFGISSSVLSQDTDFEVAEDASKVQIKNAFIKSLKTKKMNKKILSEFISLVV